MEKLRSIAQCFDSVFGHFITLAILRTKKVGQTFLFVRKANETKSINLPTATMQSAKKAKIMMLDNHQTLSTTQEDTKTTRVEMTNES